MEEGQGMLYEDMTWEEIGRVDKERAVIVLPTGCLEGHGLHLPLGTDAKVAFEICRRAAEKMEEVLILPPLYYASVTATLKYPGGIRLKPSTICQLLCDICESLSLHGFKKLLIYDAHGGNREPIMAAAKEVAARGIPLRLFYLFALEGLSELIDEIRESDIWGHACEIETSVALALFPQLVRMGRAKPGRTEYPTKFAKLVGLDWTEVNPTAVVGDPSKATKEKGERLVEAAVLRLKEALRELLELKP